MMRVRIFLEKVEFDILALGEDHIGTRWDKLSEWCNQKGKEVVRLKRTEGICSSEIKRLLNDKLR